MSRATKRRTDAQIDKMVAAYISEASRWGWRRVNTPVGQRDRFVVYRINESDARTQETVVKLTARECRDSKEAELYLNSFCSRAGMRAALAVIA